MEWLIIILIGFVGFYFYKKNKAKQNLQAKINLISNLPHFSCDEYLISADQKILLGIDKAQKRICVYKNNAVRIFGSTEILNAEIIVNDVRRSTRTILGIWGRYYIYKALLGDEHGKIAALTAPETTEKLIKAVSLKISFKDFKMPYVSVILLQSNGMSDYDFSLAFQWEGYIKIITS